MVRGSLSLICSGGVSGNAWSGNIVSVDSCFYLLSGLSGV